MCKGVQSHATALRLAILFSVLSSLSLLAGILTNDYKSTQAIRIICGMFFWGCLVLEQVFFWRADRMMKAADGKQAARTRGKPGILALPTDPVGKIVDGAFLLFLIVLLVCMLFQWGETVLQYVCVCILVLSFRLHCFLDGKNYRYIKIQKRKAK